MEKNMEFADWLMAEFVKWRANQPGHQNLRAFSKHLDVPYKTLSNWLNVKSYPTAEERAHITDALGLAPPRTQPLTAVPADDENESMINYVVKSWASLSRDQQTAVFVQVKHFLGDK